MSASWEDLSPHAERNSLFVVSPLLDLVDVAVKTAGDDTKSVSLWIESGLISRPTLDQIRQWQSSSKKEFRFLIVAPYVLIQELPH